MSRGKELRGQTLVIDGSRSGASTVVTRLAYDSAFNLEFIGEANYGSAESAQRWYLEKLTYDSAFNLQTIETAQNVRLLGTTADTVTENGIELRFSADIFFSDLSPGDIVNIEDTDYTIVSVGDGFITIDGVLGTNTVAANTVTITLNDFITKDFNKRAWTIRELYVYQ